MGKTDGISRQYLKQNEVFADIVNLMEFAGRDVITPDMLREMDTAKQRAIVKAADRGREASVVQRYRDVLKSVHRKSDGLKAPHVGELQDHQENVYVIIGVEEQTGIHYGAPVKAMLYDALNYSEQIDVLAREHRANRDKAGSSDFLSGLHKEDRLVPVKTLFVYFGTEPWDGPRSLHDMLDFRGMSREQSETFPDYPIRILEPSKLTEEQLAGMHSDLGLVLGFIKYAKDKDKLKEYVRERTGFRQLSQEAAALICQICSVDIGMESERGKGEQDMCKAIEDMKEDARQEGKLASIIALVCRKLKKGMQADVIAELLEEDYGLIQKICEAAESCGVDDEAGILDVIWSERENIEKMMEMA